MRNYNQCEFCNVKVDKRHELDWLDIKYRTAHNLVLCDRCIDKINSYKNGYDVDEYWTDEDAKKDGLPKFPYHKLKNL